MGRSPGLWVAATLTAWSLHLPRLARNRVVVEATRPHSQWRNRAGVAPDFPVMPVVGTQGVHACTTRAQVWSRDGHSPGNYRLQATKSKKSKLKSAEYGGVCSN